MNYSLIIPVFNRPDEVAELLGSLLLQKQIPHEVILVEDGSTLPCAHLVEQFGKQLPLHYIHKENSGPGLSRNFGARAATGDYFIFLDSDCILPPQYLDEVDDFLATNSVDAFGGPDRADASFTPVQKAINQAMTSFFTTGGIRRGKQSMERFHHRSFNMGISRQVFQATGGFSSLRFGEDIDLSLRMFAAGFKVELIPEAYVFHKRRTDLKKFFRQVFNSGMARINLFLLHRHSLKAVHLLPALFTLGSAALLLFSIVTVWALLPLLFVVLLLFCSALISTGSLWVALLAVPASFVQLYGYGLGFLWASVQRFLLGKQGEVRAFRKTLYK